MPEAGMYINQYEIIRKLGEGGMGAVFLGRDTRLGRRVAIKFLSSTDPELTKRFVIEARATARVEHENIVSIYEVGEWGGHPFMVLQFLQGSGLEKIIPRGKPMPVPRVIEIMIPTLRALAYAHGEGIVHRDLKPDNIFLTDAGVIKVLDFGIAKVVQGDDKTTDGEGKVSKEDLAGMGPDKGMTRHGAVMGTMPFMSPEQWGNGVAIDHTTDIWAVGIMMFIMLSGRHPLYPMTGMELMVTGFIDEPMPSLKEKAPELPKEVCDVVDKCLMKDKSKRWPDALALLRALEPLQRGRAAAASSQFNVEASPYAGLSSFQEEDAGRFFGRNREVAAMSQRLRERPLMAVVGPSGVGKSSFLRAGVVPALKNSGENWDISVLRPGRQPLMALAGLLVQISGTSTSIDDEMEIQRKLAVRLSTEPGYLGTALRRQARREKKNILVFVDQFEELYTLVSSHEERMAFTACLSAAADDATSPMRVVVSIRSDFLDRCVEDVHFMNEMSQGLFFMTPLTRDGMREALVNPAEMAGYKFENESIVNEMLDHLASTSGALPLLQFTADKLWGERDPTKKILTEKSYRALGGVAGALATHADHVLEQIPGEQRALVRALMLRLVTPERTRAIVSMDELREALGKKHSDVQGLIDQLVAARLLVVQTSGGGAATVEIVHESLIHGWPQLTKWLDEGQEDAAFLEQLRNASRQWGAKNKDSGLLWRGEMVEEAKRFVRRFRGNLPDVQQAFLKAVIDQSNRAARIRKILYVSSSIVLLALLAAAAVALYIINDSRAETQKQAIAAMEAEKKATAAAEEAEKQKVEAVKAKSVAETALEETKKAQKEREKALEAEQKAAKEAIEAKAGLEIALQDAEKAKARAEAAAKEAQAQRAIAEANMREAQEARNQATKANADLKVALVEVEQRRKKAAADAAAAEKKLKEQTGGVVEVLK
ncbi:MAG: protein kinase [Deltaproteobacteria bacterium]|nr:protein kinase [Deltaproteobacteria bacterium]